MSSSAHGEDGTLRPPPGRFISHPNMSVNTVACCSIIKWGCSLLRCINNCPSIGVRKCPYIGGVTKARCVFVAYLGKRAPGFTTGSRQRLKGIVTFDIVLQHTFRDVVESIPWQAGAVLASKGELINIWWRGHDLADRCIFFRVFTNTFLFSFFKDWMVISQSVSGNASELCFGTQKSL